MARSGRPSGIAAFLNCAKPAICTTTGKRTPSAWGQFICAAARFPLILLIRASLCFSPKIARGTLGLSRPKKQAHGKRRCLFTQTVDILPTTLSPSLSVFVVFSAKNFHCYHTVLSIRIRTHAVHISKIQTFPPLGEVTTQRRHPGYSNIFRMASADGTDLRRPAAFSRIKEIIRRQRKDGDVRCCRFVGSPLGIQFVFSAISSRRT